MPRLFAVGRALRSALTAACLPTLLAFFLAGCGETSSVAGSPSTVDDGGATQPDSEAADGATAVDDATPSSDRGPASDSSDESTGFISEEEWRRRTAPLEGEHDVEVHVSRGCPPPIIGQDFRVVPTVGCRVRTGTQPNTIRDCDVQPYCSRHEECQAQPFGRCRGSPDAHCVYPPMDTPLCASHADCASIPDGYCPIGSNDTYCYPTGRCEKRERRCEYRQTPCSSDAECTTVPGGVCQKRIISVRCEYQGCGADADCGQGMRCACSVYRYGKVCVPADCQADSDCGADQQCRLELGCHGMAMGYHCSTPLDSCRAKEDCGTDYCVFGASWHCESKFCPVGP